jgi:threonine dehydrogenase-like Zn-dependent dehydrogenase
VRMSPSFLATHIRPRPCPPRSRTGPPTEPWRKRAAERLGAWAGTAHRQLRVIEGPARERYQQWRSLLAGALSEHLQVEPAHASSLAEAGTLVVGAGALGLAAGALLAVIVG